MEILLLGLKNLFYWKQGPEGLLEAISKFKYCLGYKAASSSNLNAVENLGDGVEEKETLRETLKEEAGQALERG